MTTCITHIPCITQVTFEFIYDTLLVDNRGLNFVSLKLLLELVKGYLEDTVKMDIHKMHEFTDGCAAQYKSRNCIGDLSCSLTDLDFL